MTREEILEAITDDKMMPFIQQDQLANIVDFVIKNSQPSHPSNLDEAAHNHAANNGGRWLTDDIGIKCFVFNPQEVKDAFKAGAEWMAGQGGTVTDAHVIELNEDKGLNWLQMTENQLCDALKDFNIGDKVIVQIRKSDT